MSNKLKSILFFILLGSFIRAQTNDAASLKGTTSTYGPSAKSSVSSEFIFKPTIGLGTGVFSFYGDLYQKHFQMPMISRIGYELYITQALNDYLKLGFHALSGNLGANERFVNGERNLNFESRIFLGGIHILYDFGNFLPQRREASPFISLGIESFEYSSKTDLFDAHGNRYYYWSDNSIRNLSETDPQASKAIEIKRDYTYETDIRELNLDKFGKYPEHSFAIPVGIGATFKINDYLNFKLGTTLHFSFTDYIDGVTGKSLGNRVGNKNNDRFLMSSFSISYNFGVGKNEKADETNFYEGVENVDFLALENEDQDGDGVPDFNDSCQGTPPNVPVDARGCPLDEDEDAVPDFKDDEKNSRVDAFVDEKGVELTDSVIAYRYNFYMDSTGAFAKVVVHDHNGMLIRNRFTEKEYTVELGAFKKGIPSALMTQFLSINDIATTVLDDSTTVYTAGTFSNQQDAEKRKEELSGDGLDNIKVVYKQRGKFYEAENNSLAAADKKEPGTKPESDKIVKTTKNASAKNIHKTDNVLNDSHLTSHSIPSQIKTPGIVFRVQLGAYRRKLSKNIFKEVGDLIEIKTDDSLYKYATGSYKTLEGAAQHKVNMLLKGYEGAFITAYKDGKRITLKEAGATPQTEGENIVEIPDNTAISGVTKKLVVYKIQIGAFKNNTPAQKSKFDKLQTITESSQGFNRYLTGAFNDYESALKYKNELLNSNTVEEAFVIAYFNSQIISLQEAAELLK